MKCSFITTRLLILLFIAILFTSCATSYITSVVKSQPEHPYSSIMLVCISGNSFKGFTEENFNRYVQNNFNNVRHLKFRKQLEKALDRNLAPNGFPRIIKSSDVFKADETYTYEEFMAKVKRSGCEALLMINLKNYWYTTDYVTTHYQHSSVTREDDEPNSSYDTYLYDVGDLENYKWIGQITVEGIYAGYDTLNNYLARRVANKLRKEKMIY